MMWFIAVSILIMVEGEPIEGWVVSDDYVYQSEDDCRAMLRDYSGTVSARALAYYDSMDPRIIGPIECLTVAEINHRNEPLYKALAQ